MSVHDRLAELATGYDLPASGPEQLMRLLDALAAEPDPHTTHRDPADAVDRHIADSLTGLQISEIRGASSLVDIGAGPGFPGLPLAIALPEMRVDLLESAQRKVAVIERLIAAAGLGNARPIHCRAEEWATARAAPGRAARGRDTPEYDVATARALAPLPVLVEYAAPLLRLGGTLVAWKGARDGKEEEAAARAAKIIGLQFVEVRRVQPFPEARERHLHLYFKASPTPEGFPRRPGVAAKRPFA